MQSPLKSPYKKDMIAGYALEVGAISTGDAPYLKLQERTSDEVVAKIEGIEGNRGYNTKMHTLY